MKISTPSPRAIAASVSPAACAGRTASAVGADIAAQIQPMPDDFTVPMQMSKNGMALAWYATLDTPAGPIDVEYGVNLVSGSRETMDGAIRTILQTAWQSLELARLGRVELLHYIRKDRHTARPAAGRKLSPEAQELLDNVKRDHEARMAAAASEQLPSENPDEP